MRLFLLFCFFAYAAYAEDYGVKYPLLAAQAGTQETVVYKTDGHGPGYFMVANELLMQAAQAAVASGKPFNFVRGDIAEINFMFILVNCIPKGNKCEAPPEMLRNRHTQIGNTLNIYIYGERKRRSH